jgi:hypothetical protein
MPSEQKPIYLSRPWPLPRDPSWLDINVQSANLIIGEKYLIVKKTMGQVLKYVGTFTGYDDMQPSFKDVVDEYNRSGQFMVFPTRGVSFYTNFSRGGKPKHSRRRRGCRSLKNKNRRNYSKRRY